MTWLPPHIERCRLLDVRRGLVLLSLSLCMSGCAGVPRMQSPAATSPALRPNLSASTVPLTTPEFDILPVPVVLQSPPKSNATANSTAESKPQATSPTPPASKSGSIVAPLPMESQNKAVSGNANRTRDENKSPGEAKTEPKPQVPSANQNAAADTANAAAETNPGINKSPNSPEPVNPPVSTADKPKVASSDPKGVLVSPPKPFAWTPAGKSTGGRPFQMASAGDEGYRTLVVGSIGGNDPVALQLIEHLARRLHEDSVILGGFDSTVIRTLNPDGEANKLFLNEKGQYINELFPQGSGKSASEPPEEALFLIKQLKDLQPQRVVHVRTVKSKKGVIAASESCEAAAKEVASWLDFKLVKLPEQKTSPGSIETYISASGSSEMITFAFPESTKKEELWDLYGDTLLNLLLGDDAATREMARRQSQKSSADRRNQSP